MKTNPRQYAVTFAFTALLLSCPLRAEEWTPLFNGKDTTGWKIVGDAKAEVIDGVLHASQLSEKGGDLFTESEFDDFELRFSYKVTWPANSGVWFRYGKKGYQFDILKYKKPVAFSGTLYCPGKMFITSNLDESLENRDDWNEGRIYAKGDQIKLWLNGNLVGECQDETLSSGKIGIQVHGGKQFTGMNIAIRKMEIRTLSADESP